MQASDKNALLRDPNFRWLIGGSTITALGDQFSLIALPWLVLTMTGDALAMGLVIALMSIPRALFILVGGALVDRSSPKSILMLSKYANTLLLAVLAALVFSGHATLPLVCALALGLGLASAFSIPAGTSLLPHVVAAPALPGANAMMMGTRQLTMLAGPLLAALLFTLFGDGRGEHSRNGIALAFALDSASFLLSAWTLSRVGLLQAPPAAAPAPVLRAVGEGIAAVWRDVQLRTCMLYWALCAFAVGGTMQVALPVLASSRLDGASALGMLLAMHGAGTRAGLAAAGAGGGRLRLVNLGTTLPLIDAVVGLLLLPLGAVTTLWQALALMLAIGVAGGFMQVSMFSWLQQRVPRPMLGRAMSIFMFIFMGVAPLSAALAGALLRTLSLAQLIGGAGAVLLGAAAVAYLATPMRKVSDPPSAVR
jgi:MFS family permease